MNVARFGIYLVGLALVVGALWMLYFQTEISRWVPVTFLIVAVLLVLGFGVMAGSRRLEGERTTVVEERRY